MLLVAQEFPRYGQYLEIISFNLGLALLYVMINIMGVPLLVVEIFWVGSCSLGTQLHCSYACKISLWGSLSKENRNIYAYVSSIYNVT